MDETASSPSPRKEELLERAYQYALSRGLADMSLRPLAAAIGSSPRVLLFLFGSKDGLVRALLARARADELALLEQARATVGADLTAAVRATWQWLAAEPVRPLLTLWAEAYARSLVEHRGGMAGSADRTLALAVLRGALLDLLATGDAGRITAAIHRYLRLTSMDGKADGATPPPLCMLCR